MMEGGRVTHHLANSIGDPNNVILVVGYQAGHTLGHRLVEGAKEVRIFGDPFRVEAEIVVMNEFSAHADRNELLEWVTAFKEKPSRVFVVHGEERQSRPFAARLRSDLGIPKVTVPGMGDRGELEFGDGGDPEAGKKAGKKGGKDAGKDAGKKVGKNAGKGRGPKAS
jgi:metallo-beta-lactamase family protein